jgi:hypothetical protein
VITEILGAATGVFIGLVLFGAALAKVLRWTAFRGVVGSYRLLPEALVAPFAWLLPPVEAAIGAAVILRVGFPWSAWIAAGLFLLFAISMALNLIRGRTFIDCGCFQSALRQPLEWRLVARNIGLAALALALPAAGSGLERASDVWLAVLPASLAFYALYLALNSVWALDDSARSAFPRTHA